MAGDGAPRRLRVCTVGAGYFSRFHHDAWQRLERAERECERLRGIVLEKSWVTLPAVRLQVRERRICLRPGLSPVDYLPPDHPGGVARVLVPGSTRESAPGVFRRCADGGWTGTHLVAANMDGSSSARVRHAHGSPAIQDAWRIHLRGLLIRSGLLSGEELAVLLLANLEQLVKARIDIELHLGRISYRDALNRFKEIPALDVDTANCELTQIALNPGATSAAVIGANLLDHAVERYASTEEERKGLRDRLLEVGPIAVPLALRRCYGKSEWSRIREDTGL